MAHAEPEKCPFCPANGKVEILAETSIGYLTYVLDRTGEKMELRFFVIPKDPIEKFNDLPDDWTRTMKYLLQELHRLLEWAGVETSILDHWNLNLNNGEQAGQRVKHLHFWIIYRTEPAGSASRNIGMSALIETVNAQAETIRRLRADISSLQPEGFSGPYY